MAVQIKYSLTLTGWWITQYKSYQGINKSALSFFNTLILLFQWKVKRFNPNKIIKFENLSVCLYTFIFVNMRVWIFVGMFALCLCVCVCVAWRVYVACVRMRVVINIYFMTFDISFTMLKIFVGLFMIYTFARMYIMLYCLKIIKNLYFWLTVILKSQTIGCVCH